MSKQDLYDRAKRIKNVIKFIYEKLGKKDDQFEKFLIYANTDLASELVKSSPLYRVKLEGF